MSDNNRNTKNADNTHKIRQLLNAYRPEDGIDAYERVLKNLFSLLENLDRYTWQEITLMVPQPYGVSENSVKELIRKVTVPSISTFPMSIESEDKDKDKDDGKLLRGAGSVELKNSAKVSKVFKGFSPNEISKIYHSHSRFPSLDSMFQSNLKYQWFRSPNIFYKSNPCRIAGSCKEGFLDSLDNNYLTLPVAKLDSCNQCGQTQMFYQNRLSACNKIIQNERDENKITNFEANNRNNKPCPKLEMKQDNYENENENENNTAVLAVTVKYFQQETNTTKQAVQKDIYKMDFVRWHENRRDTTMDKQAFDADALTMDNLTASKRLETSFRSFLKRAEENISLELPALPQTRSLRAVVFSGSNFSKLTSDPKKSKNQLDLSVTSSDSSEEREKLIKQKIAQPLNVNLKVKHDSTRMQLQNNFQFSGVEKTQIITDDRKNDQRRNFSYRYRTKPGKENNVNVLNQATSITELASCKKKYYDTLLNIQKAKVAVANSLAMSSVETSTRYNPYYSRYSYQQQQLLRQQGQLMASPQFTAHTITQSNKLSNVNGTWVRYNDWSHPLLKQLGLRPQVRY